MKKTREMKGSPMPRKRLKEVLYEAGNMIASDPVNPDRSLSFIDVIVRELEKLRDTGRIAPVEASMAIDLARGQSKVINNIYRGKGRDIQPAIMFLLRQVRNRLS